MPTSIASLDPHNSHVRAKSIVILILSMSQKGFPGGLVVKNPPDKQEMWVWSLFQEDFLEMEMAIHSNILAWEIPWTEEPGSLQSMGSQRVRYNLAIQPPPPPCHKKSKCLGHCLPKGFLPSLWFNLHQHLWGLSKVRLAYFPLYLHMDYLVLLEAFLQVWFTSRYSSDCSCYWG